MNVVRPYTTILNRIRPHTRYLTLRKCQSINLLQETRLARATVDEFAEARGPARRRLLAAALAMYGNLVNCRAARIPVMEVLFDLGGTHVKKHMCLQMKVSISSNPTLRVDFLLPFSVSSISHPKGPRTQIIGFPGPKYYILNGIWALTPFYLGPWTLTGKDEAEKLFHESAEQPESGNKAPISPE